MFVFQRRGHPCDVFVLRSDDACPGAPEVKVPGHGEMFCNSFADDPALVGLQDILDRYDSCQVLRYRPGKRITIAALDRLHGPVIVKCVAHGVMDIYNRLHDVWNVQKEIGFAVGQPIVCYPALRSFVQRRLNGVPIEISDAAFDREMVRDLAGALRSLHDSTAVFGQRFGIAEQQRRSMRYAQVISARMPELTSLVDNLFGRLEELGRRLEERDHEPVPIHGSLYSHQWLRDGKDLALVDFDRAAMGYRELDMATFLAEFDYEPPTFGPAVKRTFLAGFDDYDSSALAFFRAHKHLAKAFKAAKVTQASAALAKTRRNLGRALQLLTDEQA